MLKVSREGFRKYLKNKAKPWKYEALSKEMIASLCVQTLQNTIKAYPELKGCTLHSGRGTQYTSELYRKELSKDGIIQSMNSDGGRCHDNARCENM